tara:strand:- start:827 stop:1234 length:408 start_codon:yes stop_codon:yes gene_type:complete
MTSNLNSIRSTIESRLATELASSPTIPVVFANMSFQPAVNTDFVQCLINFGQTEYFSSTNNLINGNIIFNIFTQQGIGSGANLTISKRIRDLFNKQIVNNVIFSPPNGPTFLQGEILEGYFQSIISVDFEIYEDI